MNYMFSEEDLVRLVELIQSNSHLSDDTMLDLAKVNSSGVFDTKSNSKCSKCSKCNKFVDSSEDHFVRWKGSEQVWDCGSDEGPPTCQKCDKYVDNSRDHCEAEGDQTYSSIWECD